MNNTNYKTNGFILTDTPIIGMSIPKELVQETYLGSPYPDRPLTEEEFKQQWPLYWYEPKI